MAEIDDVLREPKRRDPWGIAVWVAASLLLVVFVLTGVTARPYVRHLSLVGRPGATVTGVVAAGREYVAGVRIPNTVNALWHLETPVTLTLDGRPPLPVSTGKGQEWGREIGTHSPGVVASVTGLVTLPPDLPTTGTVHGVVQGAVSYPEPVDGFFKNRTESFRYDVELRVDPAAFEAASKAARIDLLLLAGYLLGAVLALAAPVATVRKLRRGIVTDDSWLLYGLPMGAISGGLIWVLSHIVMPAGTLPHDLHQAITWMPVIVAVGISGRVLGWAMD